ncbi:ComEC/Rec2 family competence protein [Candidatus Oscillochloris fontis]|uniref:ComEC/Rec2 family competence protein n=1 Tax=Candidatus Oscillochloris fontis TaxID=2496868 RepID=UPI00101CDC5B|nr:ComEC/Rec2 family competence protein [Candidatus Oscillochloris fontis]
MLIQLAIAWMIGIVAGASLSIVAGWYWAVGVVGVVGVRRRWGAALLVFALGALRYGASLPPVGPTDVRLLAEQGEVQLVGHVHADPTRNEEGQKLILRVEAVQHDRQTRSSSGLVLISMPPFPAYQYGERLLVTGKLRSPRPATFPGEFDYRAYLAHRGIHVLMRTPGEIRRLSPSPPGPLHWIYAAREHCRATLVRLVPEPQASLAIGILLGIQSSIPDTVADAFAVTGTSHILVVSGWNFTIVAALLAGLSQHMRIGRWPAFWLTLTIMWVYAIFTGGSAAVLRAATMASLMVLARASERQSEPWHLLFAACWLISAADPHSLWDMGFQLSALATASLFAFGRPVETWLKARPPFAWGWMAPFTEALTATLAAQVLTLPLILYAFGNLSIIAPLANILIVPVIPYTMLLGSLALVGGLIWLPLGQLLGCLLWLPLTWITSGVRILAQPSWAAVDIPTFPLWVLGGYYGLAGVLWWRKHSLNSTNANSAKIQSMLFML